MSETSEQSQFSVFIDCENKDNKVVSKVSKVSKVSDFFNSKNALQNFKRDVRNFLADDHTKTLNLSDLSNKYIKKDALVSIKEQTKDLIRFSISIYPTQTETTQSTSPPSSSLDVLKQTLKQRLKMNNCVRSNRQYAFQTKESSKLTKDEKEKKLDNDIIIEYSKIVRMFKFASNIPSPKDIFAKPSEYKEAVNFVMNDSNGMMSKLPPHHPYVRYFTLLKEKFDGMNL